MGFINTERVVKKNDWTMLDLHSHLHYEIYYLVKGKRNFFLSNALYHIEGPALIVIPPYTMHKTEGGPFERFNTDVDPEYLNPFQIETLDRLATIIIKPDPKQNECLCELLHKLDEMSKLPFQHRYEIEALFGYYIYLVGGLEMANVQATEFENRALPPLILKVIEYLQKNYQKNPTLEDIAREFYVSKATLIYKFKKYTNCSVIDFLLNIKISHAQKMLVETDMSIGEISEECGFSSQNYFGLIFKKRVSISPANYRKYYRTMS